MSEESHYQPDLPAGLHVVLEVTDTLGRVFLPQFFGLFLPPSEATSVGSSLAAMAIYLLMAAVLAWRPKGLFPVDA